MLLQESLEKYFKFDQLFHLSDYDSNMQGLHSELKALTRDCYEPNYRFIFIHYDADYYLPGQPGITLRNLQRIIKDLDISNYFCLILTQQNIGAELERLRVEETNDNCAISFIQHGLQDVLHFPKQDTSLNETAIDTKFLCLNSARRFHRTLLFSMLRDLNLIDQGTVSFCKRK